MSRKRNASLCLFQNIPDVNKTYRWYSGNLCINRGANFGMTAAVSNPAFWILVVGWPFCSNVITDCAFNQIALAFYNNHLFTSSRDVARVLLLFFSSSAYRCILRMKYTHSTGSWLLYWTEGTCVQTPTQHTPVMSHSLQRYLGMHARKPAHILQCSSVKPAE